MGERLEQIEEEIFLIREAIDCLSSVRDCEDEIEALEDRVKVLEVERESVRREAADEYIRDERELRREYFKSVL